MARCCSPPRRRDAVVPTEDVVAIARLAEVIKTNMAMLNTLMEATTIANAMKAALGEGLGGEWAAGARQPVRAVFREPVALPTMRKRR